MHVVLLSGGTGKRLWPLSNDAYSKQFLRLFTSNEGKNESMVQRVKRQLLAAHPNAKLYLSCNEDQTGALRRQLGDVEMVVEPSRRDTFSAIALSAAYLHYQKHLDEDASFLACPIDVMADETYFKLFTQVKKLVDSDGYAIGLLGASPTHPSEKYGYIVMANGRVTGFLEKPSANEAARLIADGALWNCGVFALTIGYVLRRMRHYASFDSFESLYGQYRKLPDVSFDYAVAERESSIGVVAYNGHWKDLGTWNALTEELDACQVGQPIFLSESCHNTHILNFLGIPIIAQDLTDMAVVASHDGILVSSKQGSPHIKPLVERVGLHPMYEECDWGDSRILEYGQTEGGSSFVRRLHVDAGRDVGCQSHSGFGAVWVVVSGKGIVTFDGKSYPVVSGSLMEIPHGAKCVLRSETVMDLIEVQFEMNGSESL